MTEREIEHYMFFRLFSMDFDDAMNGIALLEKVKETDVRFRLLRDIVVSYARPFSVSRGKLIPKHRCPERFVPRSERKLHDELISLRDGRFAHSDLTRYSPKVARFKTRNGYGYPMSFRGLYYENLDKRIPEMRRLIRAVEGELQKEITAMQKRLDEIQIPQYGGD